MRSDPIPPPFEPQPLEKRDLEVTVNRGMRTLPPAVVRDMTDRRHAMLDRFEIHNPIFKRRMRNYVIGTAISFPLATAMFSPTGFGNFILQVPLAALFGVLLAYIRPTGLKAGLLSAAYGMGILFFLGPPRVTYLALFCTFLFYLVIGFAIGAQEDLKASDGT